MYVYSNSDIVFLCKICNININDRDSAVQCGICQFWIHIKYSRLNHTDYKYLQGTNDSLYCISYCHKIFPFRNKNSFLWRTLLLMIASLTTVIHISVKTVLYR